jgi:hypothetical protein
MGSSNATKKLDNIYLLPDFKHVYGESLKDAWVRIKKDEQTKRKYL